MGKAASVILAGALLLGGCVSSHVMIGRARPPIPPSQVRIYFQPPPGRYERIALLQTSSQGAFAFTAQGKTDAVIERLKVEAAKLGANGVLIQGIGDRAVGSVGTGFGRIGVAGGGLFSTGIGVSGTVQQKAASGLAIYVAPQATPNAAAASAPGSTPGP